MTSQPRPPRLAPPMRAARIVVMGVSGAGKSTIGEALARALDATFIDADDLHDDAARAKMAGGTPLTDADRAPWLHRVGLALDEAASAGRPAVVACSALARRYRDAIRSAASGDVTFVMLDVDPAELTRRLTSRPGHFMPASLLDSQLQTLEPLDADEDGIRVDASRPLGDVVARLAPSLTR